MSYLHKPILLFLFIPFSLLLLVACQLPEFGEPPSWKGIQPGRTNTSEVITILGEPDETFVENGQIEKLQYPHVELWINTNCDCVDVVWVHLSLTEEDGKTMLLQEVLSLYGEPDKVVSGNDPLADIALVYAAKGMIFKIKGVPFRHESTITKSPTESIVTSIEYLPSAPLSIFLKLHGIEGLPQLGNYWEDYFQEKGWESIILREKSLSILPQ